MDYHMIFGLLLLIIFIVQIATLNRPERKNLVIKRPMRDLKAYIHSFFYLIGFARREEPGGGQQYFGRERLVFLAFVYATGLLGISGILMYMFPLDEAIMSMMNLTHALMAGLFAIVLGYHLLMHIRRHDFTNLKCIYITGRIPLWHVKRYHKIWYREIIKHELGLRYPKVQYKIPTNTNSLVNALFRLEGIEVSEIHPKVVENLAVKLKKENKPEDIKYLIKVSKMTSNSR